VVYVAGLSRKHNYGYAFDSSLTNNLFERSALDFAGNGNLSMFNNLVYGGSVAFNRATNTWTLKDNAFDSTILTDAGSTLTHDHNGYIGMTNQLTPTNATDKVLASLAYQTNVLGRYFQPTNSALINTGSQNATNAGLYHFTTTTNQVRETNSTVDIGFHLIALTSAGQLWDSDSDGIADLIEDYNGNGSWDTGETDFRNADTDGDGISDFLERILGGNPLVAAARDTNGVVNLRVYTPLK